MFLLISKQGKCKIVKFYVMEQYGLLFLFQKEYAFSIVWLHKD